MKVVLQRVSHAEVVVAGETVGSIGVGLLLLVGVEKEDGEEQVRRMAEKLLDYRVFADATGRMNLSVRDIAGELLVVSQFTLAADTGSGRRPGFSTAAAPALAESLYGQLVTLLRASGLMVETGRFAAHMQVALVNDGPVTFLLRT
jgi:D-tyrosyl-tRNA(Tyr) deacylase